MSFEEESQRICSSCNSHRLFENIKKCHQCDGDRCDVCTWSMCYQNTRICGKCFDKDHTYVCKICSSSFVDWKLYNDSICYPCKNPKRPLKELKENSGWCINHPLWQKLNTVINDGKLIFPDRFYMKNCGHQLYIYNEEGKEVAFMQYVDKFYDKSYRLEILGENVSTLLKNNDIPDIPQKQIIKSSNFDIFLRFIKLKFRKIVGLAKNQIGHMVCYFWGFINSKEQ